MQVRIAWDQFELALLVDAYLRYADGEPLQKIAKQLSTFLCTLAKNRGMTIDEKYYNINGIMLQIADMQYFFTDGRKGMSGGSLKMKVMAEMYRNQRKTFNRLLKEAKRLAGAKMFDNDLSNAEAADSNESIDIVHRTSDPVLIHPLPDNLFSDSSNNIPSAAAFALENSDWMTFKHTYPELYNAIKNTRNITLRKFVGAGTCADCRIETLPLSVRSLNCLQNTFGFEFTACNVLDTELARFAAMKNAGIKTIKEIVDVFRVYADSHPINSEVVQHSSQDEETEKPQSPILTQRFTEMVNLIHEERWNEIEKRLDTDEDLESMLRLKNISAVIGAEMVAEAIASPSVINDILPCLDTYASYVEQFHLRITELNSIISDIPSEYVNLPVKPFSDARILCGEQAYRDNTDYEGLTITQLPSVIGDYDEESYTAIKSLLQWINKLNIPKSISTLLAKCCKSDRQKAVILLRFEGKTLEETGAVYSISRERARQIENKAVKIFDHLRGGKILHKISALRGGDGILTPEKIVPYCGDREKVSIFLHLLRCCNANKYYKYSRQLDAFILGTQQEHAKRIQEYVDNLPDRIKSDEFDSLLDNAEKNGLNSEMISLQIKADYSFIDSIQVWQRGKINRSHMIEEVLKTFDPDGIHVYSPEEMNEFRNRVRQIYGTEAPIAENDRALTSVISRAGLLRDRGIYVAKRPNPIPDELLQKIRDYIEDDRTTVYMFTALFEAFKEDLIACGVDNRYYLQGILKSLWGDVYSFSKDYLSQGERVVGIYDLVESYVKNAGGIVTSEQVRDAFPGATATVIGFALGQKSILNMYGKYLHVDNLNISAEDQQRLRETLNLLLADGLAHQSDELYDLATREGREWLDRLNIPYQHALFSVAMHLYGSEYSFARPWVAAKGTPGEETVRLWHARHSRNDTNDPEETGDAAIDTSVQTVARSLVSPEIEDRFNSVLSEEFPDGLRLISMRLRKFRASYESRFHEQLEPDDDKLIRQLKSVCEFRDERIFAGQGDEQNPLINAISADIVNALTNGATCVYPLQLFLKYREELANQLSVYTVDAMKALLQKLPGRKFRCIYGLFCLPGHNPNIALDIIELFRNAYEPITYAQMQDKLWYIPIEDIKYELVREKSIVNIEQGTYFYAPNFPISSHELTNLKRAMRQRIEDDGFLVAKGLRELLREKCPGAAMDTDSWTDWGIRNVMAKLLKEDFDFNGAIISANGAGIDTMQVFRSYCKSRKRVSLDELKDLCKQVDVSGIYWYSVYDEMIRISRTEFVRKGSITFDIEATDQVLSTFCPARYRPLQEFTLYMLLPPVGVPWNGFLLESYLRDYSHLFWLNQSRPVENMAIGAMVRRGSGIHNYEQLIIDVLAHDNSWNSPKEALNILAEKGYRTQRTLSHANEVIKAALHQREKLQSATK